MNYLINIKKILMNILKNLKIQLKKNLIVYQIV